MATIPAETYFAKVIEIVQGLELDKSLKEAIATYSRQQGVDLSRIHDYVQVKAA